MMLRFLCAVLAAFDKLCFRFFPEEDVDDDDVAYSFTMLSRFEFIVFVAFDAICSAADCALFLRVLDKEVAAAAGAPLCTAFCAR